MQDHSIASEPLPSVVPGGTIYMKHCGFVRNGLIGATCAVCSKDPNQLGEHFATTQGFCGHRKSSVHKSKAERADKTIVGVFTIDGVAWCVACEKQMPASELPQHRSTRAHEAALALWEVTDDIQISGKRKPVEKVARKKQRTSAPVSTVLLQPHRGGPGAQFAAPPLAEETLVELGLQEHSLLWARIGDFMQATVTLSHARDAAVKGDLALAQACFDSYTTTISSLLQAANLSSGCHPLPSGAAPSSEGEVEGFDDQSVSVAVNTSHLGEIGVAPSSPSLAPTRTYDSNPYEGEGGGEELSDPEVDSLLDLTAEMDLERFLFGQQQTIEPKVVEGNAEDERAVQQLLALTIHDECEKEHDIAAIVRLGLQAAHMLSAPGYSLGRMSTNGLLSALGVPKDLHFPEDSEDRLTYYFQVKEWLALKRGEFSRAVFGVCSNLLVMVNLPDEHPILVGERADLERFLRWAEPRFRPNFVRLWRAALPRLHGSLKKDITQGLVTLLEKEAKWYDQQ